MVDLWDKRFDFCRDLSRGMKQRVNLAKAILHYPKVLILDEPASGMDPQSRAKMRDILKNMASRGTTVVISSHILNELSDICTQVCILHKGELIDHGPTQEVIDRGGGDEAEMLILLAGDQASGISNLLDFLKDNPLSQDAAASKGGVTLKVTGGTDGQAQLLTQLVKKDFQIRTYAPLGSGIEQRLFELHQ